MMMSGNRAVCNMECGIKKKEKREMGKGKRERGNCIANMDKHTRLKRRRNNLLPIQTCPNQEGRSEPNQLFDWYCQISRH